MKGKITPPVLLESLRYKWCEQWQRSIFPRFFNWWITELIACAPTAWGKWLSAHRQPTELRWPFQALSDVSSGAVCLVLTADEVWHSELELPKQAAHNLRSVVSYELDKYTPFTHDQIYFDVKARHIEQSDLLQVLLIIVDRPRLDKVLHEASALGINVARVDALDRSDRPLGINLMPHAAQTRAGSRLRLTRYALCALIILLLISIPATLISKREQGLENMHQELTQLRRQAMEVDGMRKQLLARDETEKALNLQSNRRQTTLEFLTNLTTCMNKDTWFDHLEIRNDNVVNLSGMSRTASELPNLLMRCATLQKAVFQGGVQPDHDSGMDHFSITAMRRTETQK